MAYFGYPEGLDVIVEAMSDPDQRIRDAAIYGLPFIEDPRALRVLLEASKSPAAQTRAAAMRALGQTTEQGEVPVALVGASESLIRFNTLLRCEERNGALSYLRTDP